MTAASEPARYLGGLWRVGRGLDLRRRGGGRVRGAPLLVRVLPRDTAPTSLLVPHSPPAAVSTDRVPYCAAVEDADAPGWWEQRPYSACAPDAERCTGVAVIGGGGDGRALGEVCEWTGREPALCWLDDVDAEDHGSGHVWVWRAQHCQFELASPAAIGGWMQARDVSVAFVEIDSLGYSPVMGLLGYAGDRVRPRVVIHVGGLRWLCEADGGAHMRALVRRGAHVVIVTNFAVPHAVGHDHRQLEDELQAWRITMADFAQWYERSAAACFDGAGAASVTPVFTLMSLPQGERTPRLYPDVAMAINQIVVTALEGLRGAYPWLISDATLPMSARTDSTWDGLHEYRTQERRGGAAKMRTLLLVHQIRAHMAAHAAPRR